MPYYVKVTKKVREALLPAYLVVQRTFDGNYLLFQSTLSKVDGNTLSERCAAVGGSLITPLEVAGEVNGTSCASCYTPKEYGGDEDTTEDFRPGENIEVPQPGENIEVPQPGENIETPKPEENVETPTPSETEAEKKTESETDKKESEVTDEQK